MYQRIVHLFLFLSLCSSGFSSAREPNVNEQRFFDQEVWPKIGELQCLKCHHEGGDAEESRFILSDPFDQPAKQRESVHSVNLKAFVRFARMQKKDRSVILQKVVGGLDHEGEIVLKPESTGFNLLEKFANSLNDKQALPNQENTKPAPFFDQVTMIEDQRLLRRVTLSLTARLPYPEEEHTVARLGLEGLNKVLDSLMTQDTFYDRLSESFNDIFLTKGQNVAPERILGYRNFGETRNWIAKKDFSHIEEEKARNKARYAFTDTYRANIHREPYELIEYIVRNDRPFTEIVTADYLMVSPLTAKSYDILDAIKHQFKDPDDYDEFIPTRLKQLNLRTGKPDQITPTGYYPHAGLLTNFHYLKRYPTTDTNRNRLRVRKFYEHFLGVDILALAPRVSNAAEVDSAFDNPVMEASDCVVCHRLIDPLAGLYQDYQNTDDNHGPYGPLKDGWFTDVFPPGFEGKSMPESERWRALQWLGEQTIQDPRFAQAMVEHANYLLTGRKVLKQPEDINDPLFHARRRAWIMQRESLRSVARTFAASDYNFKVAIKELIQSPFYRADGLELAQGNPLRYAELDDVGLTHLLTPEQLDRKIEAVFGKRWKRFGKDLRMLYGGIDSKEVTDRLQDPSGAMGSIQRIMANEVACKNVSFDFARPDAERVLFPKIEIDVVPGKSAEMDNQIRSAIVHLHKRILGRRDTVDTPEVHLTFQLFDSIVQESKGRKGIEPIESYYCKSGEREGPRDADPHYTIRAWRAVVTYLLRQHEFLYE